MTFRVQQLWQSPQRAAPADPAPLDGTAVRAFLYDAEAEDRRIDVSELRFDALGDGQLVWIDVSDLAAVGLLPTRLGLAPESVARMGRAKKRAELTFHTGYFHISIVIAVPTGLGYEPVTLDCIAGANWLLTAHQRPVELLERFDERIRGDSQLGRLDAPALVATFLHEHIASFVREIEPIELEIDQLDLEVMTGSVDDTAVFARLVNLRRRLAQLRRLLVPHREVYGLLGRPDFLMLSDAESHETFTALAERAEQSLLALETTREMIASSFEIYTTWTAHETNKVMKLLTVASVTLLPPTLLASIMGMNSLPTLLGTPAAFGITLSMMLLLGVVVLVAARRRRWI